MANPDWTSAILEHSFYVEMVDPLTLNDVRGQLDYVERSGSLTLKYYGDTRAGLTLTTVVPYGETDGWDGSAALRLVHTVGNDWQENLFTGFVTSRAWSDDAGVRTYSYELNSPLYALQTEYAASTYTVGANGLALDALKKIFQRAQRPYTISGTALNYRFGSATCYGSDETFLSICYDLADRSGDRLSVDGNGNVVVDKYINPSERAATYELDTSDASAVTIPPGSGSDDRLEIPARVIVSAKSGTGDDEVEIIGTASLASTSEFARARRGYQVDSYHSESDMEPFNQEQANAIAKKYLDSESAVSYETELSMMYAPMHEGYVIKLDHQGESGRFMVSTAALDLNTFIWKLTLKKVA